MKNTVLTILVLVTALTCSFAQNIPWAYHLGGTLEDITKSVATDGVYFYATGRFTSSTGFNYSEGSGLPVGTSLATGAFVGKFDHNGQCLWIKNIADATTGILSTGTGNSISIYNGYLYVTGTFSSGGGGKNFFVRRIQDDGTQGTTASDYYTFVGGQGTGIVANANGIFITGVYASASSISLSGCSYSQTLTSSSNIKSFLLKAAACGSGWDFLWVNISTSNKDVDAMAVAVSPNGSDLYVTGDFGAVNATPTISFTGVSSISGSGIDIFLAKFNSSTGSCSWITKAGYSATGSTTYSDYAYAVAADDDGAYITGKNAASADFGGVTLTGAGAYLAKYVTVSTLPAISYAWSATPEAGRTGYGITLLEDKVFIVGENLYWKASKSTGVEEWGYKITESPPTPPVIAYSVAANPFGELLIGGISDTNANTVGDDMNCPSCSGISFSTYSVLYKDAVLFRLNADEIFITADFSNISTISSDLHGISLVSVFKNCDPDTDPNCITNLEDEQPSIVRFPDAGNAKYYLPFLNKGGYGVVDPVKVIADVNRAYISKLTTGSPIYTTYNFTVCTPTTSYPNVYATGNMLTTDYNAYLKDLKGSVCNYQLENNYPPDTALRELIRYVKAIEQRATWPSGKKVGVIYTANIYTGTPSDLITIIKQLEDTTMQNPTIPASERWPVDVVGVELGNEPWGKPNNYMFGNLTYSHGTDCSSTGRFYDYWHFITDDGSYSSPTGASSQGNFIQEIRDYEPSGYGVAIKIGLPTPPHKSITYDGCAFGTGGTDDFTNWMAQMKCFSTYNTTIDFGTGGVIPFDAFVIHPYFDDKFWANLKGGCQNCISDTTNLGTTQFVFDDPGTGTFETDDDIQGFFDCMYTQIKKFTFDKDNDGTNDNGGWNDVIVNGYVNNLDLAGANSGKTLWLTEWNLLDATDGNTVNQYLLNTKFFHNTFLQALLVFNWKMKMYEAPFLNAGTNAKLIEYATMFNGAGMNNKDNVSERVPDPGSSTLGEGTGVDSGSDYVRRFQYYGNQMMRTISRDDLDFVPLTTNLSSLYNDLQLYGLTDAANSNLYIYFSNPLTEDVSLNTNFLIMEGNDLRPTLSEDNHAEYVDVKNDYSSAGYNYMYELNTYYYSGGSWVSSHLIPNEVTESDYNDYGCLTSGSCDNTLNHIFEIPAKSLGFVKVPLDGPYRLASTSQGETFNNGKINYTAHIQAVPNPTASSKVTFNIDYPMLKNNSYDLKIFDITGKVVKSVSILTQKALHLDLEIKNGYYIVNFYENGLSKATTKLVKID